MKDVHQPGMRYIVGISCHIFLLYISFSLSSSFWASQGEFPNLEPQGVCCYHTGSSLVSGLTVPWMISCVIIMNVYVMGY